MKKLLYVVIALTTLTSCMIDTGGELDFSIKERSCEKIYFLDEPTCAYSASAKIYIKETYPTAKIIYIDAYASENAKYLKAARYEYHLEENFSLPVICCGLKCITGWENDKKQLLDIYIQPYLKNY